MTFASRQIQEKCWEQNQNLFLIFVDLTKAFYPVNREGLWRILSHVGVLSKLINIIRSLHDGMRTTVLDHGGESDAFAVQNGTKQGCVLAPIFFSIFIACMIYDAFKELDTGIRVNCQSDGGVLNLRQLQAKTKVSCMLVRELMFADDCALAAHNEEDAQMLMDAFAYSAEWCGLTISLKKMEVLAKPKPGVSSITPNILMSQTALKTCENFPYLGSILSNDYSIDAEIHVHTAKAAAAFGRLARRLWNTRYQSVYQGCSLLCSDTHSIVIWL